MIGGGKNNRRPKPQPLTDMEAVDLGNELSSYLSTVAARTSPAPGSGSACTYTCLICHSVQRDMFNLRNHAMSHMPEDSPVIRRLDSFIEPHILQQGPSCYTCFLCRRPIRRRYKEVRTHFVMKHLDVTFSA